MIMGVTNMKKLLSILLLIIMVITLVSCSCGGDKPCLCVSCGKDIEVGDYLMEGYKVVKVCESTSEDLYAYEIVHEQTNVLYLFTYFHHGDTRSTSMTALYNRDGSLRKYGGK